MHFSPLKNPYKIRLFRCFTPTGAKIHKDIAFILAHDLLEYAGIDGDMNNL